jgi:hypothetical protein
VSPLLRLVRLALLAAVAATTGCARQPAAPPPCPRPAILDGAQTLERRSGPGPADFAWRATLTGVDGGCRYDAEGVQLRYVLDMAIVPGPGSSAQRDASIELAWFVAVMDPNGAVVDKRTFTVRSEPPAGPGPRVVREELEQRIAGVAPAEGPGWRIYFGFEVDPEEGLRRLRERRR